MNSNMNRALIFQGGGSLGAYQAINEHTSKYLRTESFRTERRD
jgi:hypothetical protein